MHRPPRKMTAMLKYGRFTVEIHNPQLVAIREMPDAKKDALRNDTTKEIEGLEGMIADGFGKFIFCDEKFSLVDMNVDEVIAAYRAGLDLLG